MTFEVRVQRKHREAEGICSFELVHPQGELLPPFTAGAHIDVHLGGKLVRQYSLCNPPQERHRYVIAVLRESVSRGGSEAMHGLSEEQCLRISEPRNHFPLTQDLADSILLAGGIGITPILCMAEQLSASGAAFRLHYAARSRNRAAFLQRLSESTFSECVQLHFDDGPQEQRLDVARLLEYASPLAHLYACGPAGFLDWVLGAARNASWPDSRLHKEYFASAATTTVGSAGSSFEVQIASTGAVIQVAAEQTVVAALACHGIELPVSCEQGVCGTCVTRILKGTPDHRDLFLTPGEQQSGDRFTPCCSRALSQRLVLDL